MGGLERLRLPDGNLPNGQKHCLGIKGFEVVGYKSWEKRSQALRSSSDYYCPEWSRNCKVF